jgi:hypothetical protein
MALTSKTLILFGIEVDQYHTAIDFKAVSGGPELKASIRQGYYSLTSLMSEISRAMQEVDEDNEYTVTADRTIGGGLYNRVTIASSGVFLSILFASGSRAGNSIAGVIGFTATDKTGSVSYQGSASTGTAYVPERIGYNYRGPDDLVKQDGVRTVSASGVKEAIVFGVQQFVEIQFKYCRTKTLLQSWMKWATQQKKFEITPEITNPEIFYNVTLDKTPADSNGMAFELSEMLGLGLPNHWDTGLLRMRVVKSISGV